MTNTPTADTAPTRTSDLVAYHVRDREGKKSIWTRIGGVWAHADGKGFNIQIDVVPLDGRITLREYSDKKD